MEKLSEERGARLAGGSVSKRNSCSTPSWASVRQISRYSVYLKELSCGGGFERATAKVGTSSWIGKDSKNSRSRLPPALFVSNAALFRHGEKISASKSFLAVQFPVTRPLGPPNS